MDYDKIVFSDLDGTILDKETYSYSQSLPAIRWLKDNNIPLIFCSAKTRSEIDVLRNEISNQDPYIVENGSAIIIPKGYFPFELGAADGSVVRLELGARLEKFQSKLDSILESTHVRYSSFAEMTREAVSKHSGLSLEQAALAMKREYTMTLVISKDEIGEARRAIESNGLTCFSGGKSLTVGDGGNKGRAVKELANLFARIDEKMTSYAFGDGENDMSMLREVDFPILVQSSPGHWAVSRLQKVIRVPLVGPEGFAKGVEEIIKPSGRS